MLGKSNRISKFCISKKQARQWTQNTTQVNMGFWSRLELIYRNFSKKVPQANPAGYVNFNPFLRHFMERLSRDSEICSQHVRLIIMEHT
jgi:hypothetical protein